MISLSSLKAALRRAAESVITQKLSDTQYESGFATLLQHEGWNSYQDFIIPHLAMELENLVVSESQVSILEIGPGPKSILSHLPGYFQRRISKYTAFEPRISFAVDLEKHFRSQNLWLHLNSPPDIRRSPFTSDELEYRDQSESFDMIIFCHSMYGMKPAQAYVERALQMLTKDGLVVIFHRDGVLDVGSLLCHRSAAFPSGIVRVRDDDQELECFSAYIAGFALPTRYPDNAIRAMWLNTCRTYGARKKSHPEYLFFSAPEKMMIFTKHATALQRLLADVSQNPNDKVTKLKNYQLRCRSTTAIVRPSDPREIQACIGWAQEHKFGLTIIGGAHSGHCIWPNVVALDMGAFNKTHIVSTSESNNGIDTNPGQVIVVGAGCKVLDIIKATAAVDLTVPLGDRPSVGAGLWLHGGIGPLTRLHGLTCDAIIGAVVVCVKSSRILYIGCVPKLHRPEGAIRPDNDADLLWALRGAGSRCGIVISLTFRTFPAPTYKLWRCAIPCSSIPEMTLQLQKFDHLLARKLPTNCTSDACLYWENGQLYLGVSTLDIIEAGVVPVPLAATKATQVFEEQGNTRTLDASALFDTPMYLTTMHGGHGGGKTSSFKRCVFLKGIGQRHIAKRLTRAIQKRPTPLSYLHLLQGGGRANDVATDHTAFGCRGFEFACVVTGVWQRDEDSTAIVATVMQWVYDVVTDLLPVSIGVYSADLGPGLDDEKLARQAFGPNLRRLNRQKEETDPYDLLRYHCPLPRSAIQVILLITGKSGSGKDFCAGVWAEVLAKAELAVLVVSISEATKREYAKTQGADFNRLMNDRAYKELHRPALTAFFQRQLDTQPHLLADQFLSAVISARNTDVLLITGMRDVAPVSMLSHLISSTRLVEIRVHAGEVIRHRRRGSTSENMSQEDVSEAGLGGPAVDSQPDKIFNNDRNGEEQVRRFAADCLLPLFDPKLRQLEMLVRQVQDFPCHGNNFRHVLGIAEQPGGLELCTNLLETHFSENWESMDAIVACESGGWIFASALALKVKLPLSLVRASGKLPDPTFRVDKRSSFISSLNPTTITGKAIEMSRHNLTCGDSVVIVEDVLSSGETLFAILQILSDAGVDQGSIHVMAVAEFPHHRGRSLLRERGYGSVKVQSLLVFGGS